MRHCILIMAWLWSLGLKAQVPFGMDSASVAVCPSVAADFDFVLPGGDVHRLSGLSHDKLTLLVFYDPDCGDCRQELFALRHSSIVNSKVSEGLLRVLAVYTGGDTELWRESLKDLPAEWVAAKTIGDMDGYDLSVMPVVFLLDADGKVMLYNPSLRQLSALIESLWLDP